MTGACNDEEEKEEEAQFCKAAVIIITTKNDVPQIDGTDRKTVQLYECILCYYGTP